MMLWMKGSKGSLLRWLAINKKNDNQDFQIEELLPSVVQCPRMRDFLQFQMKKSDASLEFFHMRAHLCFKLKIAFWRPSIQLRE